MKVFANFCKNNKCLYKLLDLICCFQSGGACVPSWIQTNPRYYVMCMKMNKRPTCLKGHLHEKQRMYTDLCPKSLRSFYPGSNFAIFFHDFNDRIGHTLAQEPLTPGIMKFTHFNLNDQYGHHSRRTSVPGVLKFIFFIDLAHHY